MLTVHTFTALVRVPWSQYSMTMQREPPGPLNEVKYFTMLLWCRFFRMLISSLESFLGFWIKISVFMTRKLEEVGINEEAHPYFLHSHNWIEGRELGVRGAVHLVDFSKGAGSQ